MKKLRCPNCGQKTLTLGVRLKTIGIHEDENAFNERYRRHAYSTRYSNNGRCPECDCTLAYILPGSYAMQHIMQVVYGLAAIIVAFLAIKYRNPYIMLILLCITLVVFGLVMFMYFRTMVTCRPLKYVDDEGLKKPTPNIRATIADTKYIKPYGVYGLKFEQGRVTNKFKEAFPDGLVPAVFLPDKNGDSKFEIQLINKSVLNDDMLFVGAEFLVEDSDGIFVTKGVVEKTELEW